MKIVLDQGDALEVSVEDGTFKIVYGPTALTVEVDMPDAQGRSGVIYNELVGPLEDEDEDPFAWWVVFTNYPPGDRQWLADWSADVDPGCIGPSYLTYKRDQATVFLKAEA